MVRLGKCSVCQEKDSKYTCPRCGKTSCSLASTKQHKAQAKCSGERDKTAYVVPNEYGDIAMWRDFSYLQEVSRKVGDLGKEALANKSQWAGHRIPLKTRLAGMGIEMVLLPREMHRSRTNQSSYNKKYPPLSLGKKK